MRVRVPPRAPFSRNTFHLKRCGNLFLENRRPAAARTLAALPALVALLPTFGRSRLAEHSISAATGSISPFAIAA